MRPLEETEASWVPDYFGDEYLHLYQFPAERTDPEVAFLVSEFTERISPAGRVLDLACGQGRHAVALAKQGYCMVGLDYQRNLLEVATQAAQDQGVDASFVCGDMRKLPFQDGVFDAVTNLFTAFGYFSDTENRQVLGEVARVLRPDGYFIIDVANRDALIRQAQQRSWKRLPDGTMVVSEWTWDVQQGRYTHWQFVNRDESQRTFRHSVRVYTYTELAEMLHSVGLVVEAVYGDFSNSPITLDTPRMICIAHKQPL